MPAQELAKTILANSSNLKFYARFESGALTTDSSGNSHTLTAIGSPSEGTGKFGGGVDLVRASSQAYSAVNHADFRPTGSFSFGGWFKTSTSGSTQFIIQSQAQVTNVGGIALYISGGTNKLVIQSGDNTGVTLGSDYQVASSASTVTDGNWHLGIGTWDGSTLRVYLDGVHSGSTTWANAPGYQATNYVRVGCDNNTGTNGSFFNGSLDDVFFINGTALSADQIKELYEGHIYGELRPNQFGTTVGLWHLNGNSTDFSGNNNHGTDTNITYSAANGKWGQGASIPSNGRIAIASTLLLSGACSIGFWIKPGNYSADGYVFTSYTGAATSTGLGILLDSSEVISIGVNDATKTIQSTTGLSQSVFTHVVFVINGSSSGIYINGSLNASGTLATLAQNTNAFRFNGRWTSGSTGDAVQGAFTLEEPFCASTALTANQIRQIYAYQKGLLGRYA